jgi:hypothetical protein
MFIRSYVHLVVYHDAHTYAVTLNEKRTQIVTLSKI